MCYIMMFLWSSLRVFGECNGERNIHQKERKARQTTSTETHTYLHEGLKNLHFSHNRPMATPGCLRHMTRSGWCLAMFRSNNNCEDFQPRKETRPYSQIEIEFKGIVKNCRGTDTMDGIDCYRRIFLCLVEV